MATAMQTLVRLDGRSLTLDQLLPISRGQARLVLDPAARAGIEASRQLVERVLAEDETTYGVNTGFGRLSTVRISPEQVKDLQRNLVRSHAAGVGERLPDHQVRTLIALRINSLMGGRSGIRYSLLEALLALLEREVYPVVPSRGSVGASGDLAPLAHVALVLMGEGSASHQGRTRPTPELFAELGLQPFAYEAKEALALINGTQLMTTVGGLALAQAANLLKVADIVAAMSLEALLGTDTSLNALIHAARPHPGQGQSAANLRACVERSALVASHKNCDKVQDAYSLRCVPQVHGAAREGWGWASSVVEREINSVTDNPLVFPEEGVILSGGNFHGAPVALALDCSAVALSYLGTISERRCDRLLNPDTSELPAFLTRQQGLNSGLMLAQYVAAALASENKIMCHPASADTIPTSAGHEDHVSMGPAAAYKLERLLANVEQILACEWVCASQALEFHRPLTFGPGTEAAFSCLREHVAPLAEDRPLHGDLEIAARLVREGCLVAAVEARVGALY